MAPIATIDGSRTKLLGISNVVLDKHDRIVVPMPARSRSSRPERTGTSADVTTVGTDAGGSIYGTNAIDGSHLKFSLIVFDSNANGNVAPARIVSGSHTHIVDTFYPTTY